MDGFRSYCDPLRSLSKYHTSVSSGDSMALLLAKSLSYFYCDGHTPIIGELARSLILYLRPRVSVRRLKRAIAYQFRSLPWSYQLTGEKLNAKDVWLLKCESRVDKGLRGAFSLRTGLTPDIQISYEAEFRSWIRYGIPARMRRIPVEWTGLSDTKYLNCELSDWIT